MKKILLATNILLLGIIVFQACSTSSTSNPGRSCSSCGDPNARLEGVISGDLLDTLSGAYLADVYKSFVSDVENVHIDPNHDHSTERVIPDYRTGRDSDALSMFFDLGKIKTFISKVENSVCTSGCDTSIKLGIRFYYIKYRFDLDKDNELAGLPRNYNNKHALAMVPVYKSKRDGKWYDFFFNPNPVSGAGCVFDRTIIDIDGGYNTFALVGGDGDGTNHGGVGPPPAPGTFPTSEEQ
ncbi:MAG TPA: hypothetical protein VGO58_01660 [Chitinophagaceae bacterium]|jgi:hypothetical protein|nr:hypothetical protein [Chitinophagaceae bacterium]